MTNEPVTTPSNDTGRDDVDDIQGSVQSEHPGLNDINLQKFVRLSRRVCLIRRTEGPDSTGFLVGPDLILTAAHNLMGTSGIFVHPEQVTILFDQFIWDKRSRRRAQGDQCGLRRIPFTSQPDIVASSISTDPWCRRREPGCDRELDYALVRLDRPMGLSYLPYSHRIRGWTDCSIAKIPAVGQVYVVQHPLGGLQKFAPGKIREGDSDAELPKHFKYYTEALVGTSGAPIVADPGLHVVGLHVGERVEKGADGKDKTVEETDNDGKKVVRRVVHQLGLSLQDVLADIHAQGVRLPSNELDRSVLDTIFGSSDIEPRRHPSGKFWGGDRLFHKP